MAPQSGQSSKQLGIPIKFCVLRTDVGGSPVVSQAIMVSQEGEHLILHCIR